MISQVSVSEKIFDAVFKAKETLDNEYQELSDWITDIIENENRLKVRECEICSSNKKLELHHIRGRKHGNEIITICQKCHKILTDKQRLWGQSWLDPNAKNKDTFLIRGLINVCELKHQKTGKEIYKLIAEELTEGFSYE